MEEEEEEKVEEEEAFSLPEPRRLVAGLSSVEETSYAPCTTEREEKVEVRLVGNDRGSSLQECRSQQLALVHVPRGKREPEERGITEEEEEEEEECERDEEKVHVCVCTKEEEKHKAHLDNEETEEKVEEEEEEEEKEEEEEENEGKEEGEKEEKEEKEEEGRKMMEGEWEEKGAEGLEERNVGKRENKFPYLPPQPVSDALYDNHCISIVRKLTLY